MLLPWLAWLVTAAAGLPLSSPDGVCEAGWTCKKDYFCARYSHQWDRLQRLNKTFKEEGDAKVKEEYQDLAENLKELVCNKEENGVCCQDQVEVLNGNIVERVEDMPYIVRLSLKASFSERLTCGASLISSRYLLSAKHCFEFFWDECYEVTDCIAYFRDLKPGNDKYERGEFWIQIKEVYVREGDSDLAVVELKYPVEEHPEYKLGNPFVPLTPIRLAKENPKPGEEVLTGGWGLTGRV